MKFIQLGLQDKSEFEDFVRSLNQSPFMNWSPQQLMQSLELYTVWAAWDGSEIQCAMGLRPTDQDWEILWVQTRSLRIRKGCAFQLLTTWLDNASHSIGSVWLEVHQNNFAALKLYEKLNFKNHSFRKNYYADGAGAHVMVRHFNRQLGP